MVGASHIGAIARVVGLFFLWKLVMLLTALSSPGPGYDTSTQLLLPELSEEHQSLPSRLSARVLSRLIRWDAVYYVTIANRGYRFEQEWAFSWLPTKLVGHIARASPSTPPLPPVYSEALVAARFSHLFHLFGALVLYTLTYRVLPGEQTWRRMTAFVAACLFVISPAGLFLSAPYSETMCAFFNFTGMLFASIMQPRTSSRPNTVLQSGSIVFAGIFFGLATLARSNGVLSVLVFLQPGLVLCNELLSGPQKFTALVKLFATGVGALITLLGAALPQYIAYQSYCTGDSTRPWCQRLVPSIYSWVQEEYWNVGLFKYWTLSNIPLFLLAAPMLVITIYTASVCLLSRPILLDQSVSKTATTVEVASRSIRMPEPLRWFALPQLVLAVLTLTNFHVQIINRISTAYPVWYILIAVALTSHSYGNGKHSTAVTPLFGSKRTRQWVVRSMMMYAMIQGGLFASFMPPA